MARGPSGRVVIEVGPVLKGELHAALAADGTDLKHWFLGCVATYLSNRRKPKLSVYRTRADGKSKIGLLAESPSTYGCISKKTNVPNPPRTKRS